MLRLASAVAKRPLAAATTAAAAAAAAGAAHTEPDASPERARHFIEGRLARFRAEWGGPLPLPPVVVSSAADGRVSCRFKLPPNALPVPLLLDVLGAAGPQLAWRVLGEAEAAERAAAGAAGRYVGMRALHLEGRPAAAGRGAALGGPVDVQLCVPPGGGERVERREECSADGRLSSRTTVVLRAGSPPPALLELTLPAPGGAAQWAAGELLAAAYESAHTAACAGGRAGAAAGAEEKGRAGGARGLGGAGLGGFEPFRALLEELEDFPRRHGQPRGEAGEPAEGGRRGSLFGWGGAADAGAEGAEGAEDGAQPPPRSAAEAIEALSALGARVYMPEEKGAAGGAEAGARSGGGVGGGLRGLLGGKAEGVKAEGREGGRGLFDWPGLGGYGGVKAALEEALLLPLCQPALYAQVRQMARAQTGGGNGCGAEQRPLAPAAILFEGPPGTGKTSFARAAAAAAGVPLVYAPLESLGSRWYGESEARLARLFDAAHVLAQTAGQAGGGGRSGGSEAASGGCILFLDEIDALALSRDTEMHEASRRSLSVLLRQLDGIDATPYAPPRPAGAGERAEGGGAARELGPAARPLVLIGATNRAADLDRALLSRFSLTLTFPLPDCDERAAILGVHAAHLSAAERSGLARASEGASGRALRSACDAAERSWAAQLVRARLAGRAVEASAPPASEYAAALEAQRKAERRVAGGSATIGALAPGGGG